MTVVVLPLLSVVVAVEVVVKLKGVVLFVEGIKVVVIG